MVTHGIYLANGDFGQRMPRKQLTLSILMSEARAFTKLESAHADSTIFGVTDGKAVGTYVELKFRRYLAQKYEFDQGNTAKGIDFPSLDVDLKVTSIKQPQSSCPYKSARQKIYGLGYSLLIFVYDKIDEPKARTSTLNFIHVIFIKSHLTGDFQMTRGIREILENHGNADDLVSFMSDKNLPQDDIAAANLAEDLLHTKPEQGYLTISNALQWRLQYTRVIEKAGQIDGITRLG